MQMLDTLKVFGIRRFSSKADVRSCDLNGMRTRCSGTDPQGALYEALPAGKAGGLDAIRFVCDRKEHLNPHIQCGHIRVVIGVCRIDVIFPLP
jgi:hypothetical protein